MKMSESLSNISKSLIAVQKKIKGIEKNAQGHGYKYMTFDAVLTLVKPVLSENNLFLLQDVKGEMVDGENIACCQTMILHESGEWIQSDTLLIKPVGKQLKGGGYAPVDPQSVGSALTYAKRYQLCGMLGINADVDDDAMVASQLREWYGMSEEQKVTLTKLIQTKGINVGEFAKLTIQVLGQAKEFKSLTKEDAELLIKDLNNKEA